MGEKEPNAWTNDDREESPGLRNQKILEEIRAREAAEAEAKRKASAAKRAAKSGVEQIAKKSISTKEQIDLLRKFGIQPLITKQQNSRQISYILKGNEKPSLEKERTPGERAALLKNIRNKWEKKRVMYKPRGAESGYNVGRIAKVAHVLPEMRKEILSIEKHNREVANMAQSSEVKKAPRFRAALIWEDDEYQRIVPHFVLSNLVLLEEQDAKDDNKLET